MKQENRIISVGDIHIQVNPKLRITKRDDLVELYWMFHPRFRFLKAVPYSARFLDVGAGSGGLIFWKQWGRPSREDVEIHGIDVKKGMHTDRYASFKMSNVEENGLAYENGFFDAVFLSHVLEHFEHPEAALKEIRRVLKPEGRVYFEFPSMKTMSYPSRELFLAKGIKVSTINFFDDSTHKQTYDIVGLSEMFSKTGLKIIESGVIQNKYLEDDLVTYGVQNEDEEITTYGVWSRLQWAEYVICTIDQ